MANRHFARIGDVWKHLPLCELLTLEQPTFYCESHAGAALYPLTRSPDRDFGVYHFLERSPGSGLLSASRYRSF
jgi:23S rRNA (adenine2030-N6)-methyltransferase